MHTRDSLLIQKQNHAKKFFFFSFQDYVKSLSNCNQDCFISVIHRAEISLQLKLHFLLINYLILDFQHVVNETHKLRDLLSLVCL